MACCCVNIKRLCKVGTCAGDSINLGIPAIAPGIYKLQVEFLESQFTIEETFEADEELSFPTVALNENYTFTAKLYGPDGAQIKPTIEDIEYDCFQFETSIFNVV